MLGWISQPHKSVIDSKISRLLLRYPHVKSKIAFKTNKFGMDWVYDFQQIDYQFESRLESNFNKNCLDLDTFQVLVTSELEVIDGKWHVGMSTIVIIGVGQIVYYFGRTVGFLLLVLAIKLVDWKFILATAAIRYIYYLLSEFILLLFINIKLASKALAIKQVDRMILKVNLASDVFYSMLVYEGTQLRAKAISGLPAGSYMCLEVTIRIWTLEIESLVLDAVKFNPSCN